MKTLILCASLLVLAGCEKPPGIPAARAEARIALFKQCMELAAKMTRQGDDDVADVVDNCSTQALYMTNHIQ